MKKKIARRLFWAAALLTLSAWASARPQPFLPADAEVKLEEEPALPVVALTFDDGPRASATPRLLDGLALREVPATFFLSGYRIPGQEELLHRMAAEGHQVGVHTWDHISLRGVSRGEFDRQVADMQTYLCDLLGPGEYWLRPPYGQLDQRAQDWLTGPMVLWSVDPEDWKIRDPQEIADHVLNRVKDGDIILLHDIFENSVDAALLIVDGLLEQGYEFVTVRQLLERKGLPPRNGEVILCCG